MRAIDMHSHYSTKKGYCVKTPEDLAGVKKFLSVRSITEASRKWLKI